MSFTYSRSPDLQEVLRAVLDNRLAQLHVALPGEVVRYNAQKQIADIRPLVRDFTITLDAEEIIDDFPVIPNVPVMFPRANDFFISMPLQRGDKVLLIFNERSIGNYTDGDGSAVVDPEERTMHSLDDAVCFPGFYPNSQGVNGASTECVVLGKSGEAQEAIAMAEKVKTELEALRGTVDSLITAYNAHTHPYIDTPAGPSVTSPTTSSGTPPAAVNDMGSTSVKVTE